MKHQPYESWVFMLDELDASQQGELDQHLMACEQCSGLSAGWLAIEEQLAEEEILQPVDGFAKRWQIRLGEQQAGRHKKQTSILFSLLSVGGAIVFLPLVLRIVLLILSPEDILFDVVRDAIDWFGWLGFVSGLATTVLESLLETISPLAWFGFISFISLLSSVWLISVHQLSLRTQIERSTTQ